MHARAAAIEQRFGQEGQDHALLEGHLARKLAEHHGFIDGLERLIEGEGEFVLRRVVFGGDHIELETGGLGGLPDRVSEPQRIVERTAAIDMAARHIIGHQRAILGAGKGEGFQLDPHFGGQAVPRPVGNRRLEPVAAQKQDRRAVAVGHVAGDHMHARLPARADVGGVPCQGHVGQALKAIGARRVDDQVLVIMHGKARLGKAGRAGTDLFLRQVFRAQDRQMVAPDGAQTVTHEGSPCFLWFFIVVRRG